MSRKERRQVLHHPDRPHARAAAAVGNAERLVQVQVADVGADVARAAEPDLRVHVGAVHVDLAAVLVHDAADLPDRPLEHAVGAGIGDHQRGERVPMRRRLRAEIVEVDVAPRVALDRHHLHPRHHRARRIGPVGRLRDEAGDPVRLTPRPVVRADDQQPGVLALRAGVGLERHRGESGDLGELVLQLAEQQLVSRGLIPRREGMQPVELPPAHRHHLGRRVELHGAGAERDHRGGERQVARLQPLDVAQHLGLGVVPVEHRVLQVRGRPLQRRRDRALRLDRRCRPA